MKNRKFVLCCMLCLLVALCLPTAFATEELGPQPEDRPQGEALSLREWSAEELESLQRGLSERSGAWAGHGLPSAEQIQLPQALALTEQALQQHMGLTSDTIATFTVLPYFMTVNGQVNINGAPVDLPAPYWQMYYGNGEYTVYLDASTGAILAIPGLSDGNG